jgi:hypothetical protein
MPIRGARAPAPVEALPVVVLGVRTPPAAAVVGVVPLPADVGATGTAVLVSTRSSDV